MMMSSVVVLCVFRILVIAAHAARLESSMDSRTGGY
jgi:hypothetical protein